VAPPQRQRVVLVHGFTQTGASWDHIAGALRDDGCDVVTPTLPGHGGIPAADLTATAAQLVAATEHESATWVGYSMGGRACLHVALSRPSAVERLVLLGATAGIDDPAERNARRHRDELLATRIEAIGVERFVEEWLAQPMFEHVPSDAGGGAEARTRDNTAAGLAGALRLAGTGAQEPLWDRLHEIGVLGIPTLVLAGELDGKFKVLAKRLADAIGPTARTEWVPGAGHAAHLEQPDAFVTIVRRFLDPT
jgi:2-succinyl-6-hydroxy-2,4-cyclohexadiene-1-carboxylate synthase